MKGFLLYSVPIAIILALAFGATESIGDWGSMEVTRVSMYVCPDETDSETCTYVDSANPSQVPHFSGVAFIGADAGGNIDYLQVAGSLITGGVEYFFMRQIQVGWRAGGQRVLYSSLWNGEAWIPGAEVHIYQLLEEKLKFMIQYGDPLSVEMFAVNQFEE